MLVADVKRHLIRYYDSFVPSSNHEQAEMNTEIERIVIRFLNMEFLESTRLNDEQE